MDNWPDHYIGIPWQWRGRTKRALDCWGLVCLVYQEQRSINLDTQAYADTLDSATLIDQQRMRWPETTMPATFNVAIIRAAQKQPNGRYQIGAFHVGLAAGDQQVLHAQRGVGVVLVPTSRLQIMSWHQWADQ